MHVARARKGPAVPRQTPLPVAGYSDHAMRVESALVELERTVSLLPRRIAAILLRRPPGQSVSPPDAISVGAAEETSEATG